MLTSTKLGLLTAISALIALSTGCAAPEQPTTTSSTGTAIQSAVETTAQTSTTITDEELASKETSLDCDNAQTQTEINACAALEAQAADKKLNEVYQQLQAKIQDSPQEQRLIEAQQKWIKFRDADCEYAKSQYEGGSIVPTIEAACITRLTEQRTKDLEEYLEEASL
ncbi:MAG: DUF1311 domain-containing protein [Symploca sp. SIO2C1]|nr:DUF1311 domain-containing protein [Symploca sp. SIO2C1]